MEVGMTLDECADTFCELAQVMKDAMNIQRKKLMNDNSNNTKELSNLWGSSLEKEASHCSLCADVYTCCNEQKEPYMTYNYLRDDLKMNYCPACGRKLKEECIKIDPSIWKARLNKCSKSLYESDKNKNKSIDIKQLTADKVDYRSENGNHQLIIDGVRVALISVSINYVTRSYVSGTNIATFTYYMPGDTTPKIISVNYQSNEVFDQ